MSTDSLQILYKRISHYCTLSHQGPFKISIFNFSHVRYWHPSRHRHCWRGSLLAHNMFLTSKLQNGQKTLSPGQITLLVGQFSRIADLCNIWKFQKFEQKHLSHQFKNPRMPKQKHKIFAMDEIFPTSFSCHPPIPPPSRRLAVRRCCRRLRRPSETGDTALRLCCRDRRPLPGCLICAVAVLTAGPAASATVSPDSDCASRRCSPWVVGAAGAALSPCAICQCVIVFALLLCVVCVGRPLAQFSYYLCYCYFFCSCALSEKVVLEM